MMHPRMIGQYQIVERLGTGGIGEVYKGIDTKVGREVAIKLLRPELAMDPGWSGRFLAEAKSLGRLNHPNIATLYTLVQDDEHVSMVMELVRGRTIEQITQEKRGSLPVRECLAIIAQAAEGLSYAHDEGVIHRDIKPANLMVTESGRVKIMDFGIARVQGSARLTRTGTAVGTALYMSPEQHQGLEGDERSDIYSLAIVLYELLSGGPPFKGTTDYELAKAHLTVPPPPLIPRVAGVTPELESAIMKALAKRSEQRFASMQAFSDAVGATALRGDAQRIILDFIRPEPGKAEERAPQERAPFHTLALAVARSRAMAIARRFNNFSPAVKGMLAGSVAAGIAALAIYHFEPARAPSAPVVAPRDLAKEELHANKMEAALSARDKAAAPYEIAKAPAVQKEDSGACPNGTMPGFFNAAGEPECVPLNPQKDEHAGEAPKQKPAVKPQGDNWQQEDKASYADFETAYNQGDFTRAYSIAKKLDAAKDPAGTYGLGLLYLHGDGVPQNDIRAKDYFFTAADNGHSLAALKLAQMYYYGKVSGVAKSKAMTLARKWFETAAGKGVGEAMFDLGSMSYDNIAGLKRVDSQEWYRKAAKAGYAPAKERLEELGVATQ